MDTTLRDDFTILQRGDRNRRPVCFLEYSLNKLWAWSWASLREGSSFGGLSEMQQGLERDGGGGLGWSFHENIPDSGYMNAWGWGEASPVQWFSPLKWGGKKRFYGKYETRYLYIERG